MSTMANGTKNQEIEVSDTLLATWLQTQGFRPTRITGSSPRRAFVFQDVPAHLIQAFALDTARVSPAKFGQTYKSLLRRLHEA